MQRCLIPFCRQFPCVSEALRYRGQGAATKKNGTYRTHDRTNHSPRFERLNRGSDVSLRTGRTPDCNTLHGASGCFASEVAAETLPNAVMMSQDPMAVERPWLTTASISKLSFEADSKAMLHRHDKSGYARVAVSACNNALALKLGRAGFSSRGLGCS